MKPIAIYGAGGFGKEVRAFAEMQGLIINGFLDDYKPDVSITGNELYDDVILAIANPDIRKSIIDRWDKKSVPFNPLIHSSVRLHTSIKLGKGCIICAGVQMTADIILGNFVIVNLNVTIGHDVVIGDYCSIMPGANISGSVRLGKQVFIGSGATILQGLTVGDGAIIGAGAVVTKHVIANTTVVGVPAKPKQG